MTDRRTLRRRADYDAPEFATRWRSKESVESIALDLDVTPQAVRKAAIRRGLGNKTEARNNDWPKRQKI